MGSHTRIVHVEARCNLFWLAFSGWAGVSRPSFPGVRTRSKDTPAKPQLLVIYDVKFKTYLANPPARLAKWQSTRSRATSSLQSIATTCYGMLMYCNDVQ